MKLNKNQWILDNMEPLTTHEEMISDNYNKGLVGNPYAPGYCMQPPVHCKTCSLVNYGMDCHNNINNLLITINTHGGHNEKHAARTS